MKKLLSCLRVGVPMAFLAGLLLVPGITFAAEGSDTLKGLAEISGVIIEILTFLALLMLNFFGDLLGTDMITGKEAMEAIRPMWVWVRNLTNIMFVGVLLFLAFSNLFSSLGVGGEGGNWTIKEKLPKLIIAMIAINFSLLGFRVVIDAINVGTVAILGIADQRLEGPGNSGKSTLGNTRSWVEVTVLRKGEIKSAIKDPSKHSVEYKEVLTKADVTGEANCLDAWDASFPGITECQSGALQCAVFTVVGSKNYTCRGFTEQINDLFCRDWINKGENTKDRRAKAEADDKCVFMMQPDKFSTILEPSSEPGQNLFAAFGSTFMHLERLPALGAEINSLGSVVTNTLFSAIMALAFIVALVAVFIAMIVRMIVLWVVLVFSPLLVGASILGVDGGKGGDISAKIVTHLIMPLKVAAAFAVGFVMMSAMVEWSVDTSGSTFIFGPALSQLGVDEFGFLWQIATIVLFWTAAFWAVEGSLADKLIQGVKSGAETLATVTAKSLTVDRPMFSVGTGSKEASFSLGSMLKLPKAIGFAHEKSQQDMYQNMQKAFNITPTNFEAAIRNANITDRKAGKALMLEAADAPTFFREKKDYLAKLQESGHFTTDEIQTIDKAKTESELSSAFTAMSLGGFTSTEWGTGKVPTPTQEVTEKTEEEKKITESIKEVETKGEGDKKTLESFTHTNTEGVVESKTLKPTDISSITAATAPLYAAAIIKGMGDGNKLTMDQLKAVTGNPELMKAFDDEGSEALSVLGGNNKSLDVTIVANKAEAEGLGHDNYIILEKGVVTGHSDALPDDVKTALPTNSKEIINTNTTE